MANKGEMSELYTLFRLAAERSLQLANVDFEAIPDTFIEIKEVIREGKDGKLEAIPDEDGVVHILLDGVEKFELSQSRMGELADITFRSMITDGNYEQAELFLDEADCSRVKSDSSSKTDITLRVHDARSGTDPVVRYSIKSDVGQKSTLYNATPGAMFTYEIKGEMNDELMKKINAFQNDSVVEDSEITTKTRGKVKKKFAYLADKGFKLEFVPDESPFISNLMYVDSGFPKVLAEMTALYYSKARLTDIHKITDMVIESNPLHVPIAIARNFYVYKVRQFLELAALGMTQGTPWNIRESVTGGIILVKRNGDIVCYHLFDRDEFQNHLFQFAKIDTPSTSRHNPSQIWKTVDGKYRISVAMQIKLDKTKGEIAIG